MIHEGIFQNISNIPQDPLLPYYREFTVQYRETIETIEQWSGAARYDYILKRIVLLLDNIPIQTFKTFGMAITTYGDNYTVNDGVLEVLQNIQYIVSPSPNTITQVVLGDGQIYEYLHAISRIDINAAHFPGGVHYYIVGGLVFDWFGYIGGPTGLTDIWKRATIYLVPKVGIVRINNIWYIWGRYIMASDGHIKCITHEIIDVIDTGIIQQYESRIIIYIKYTQFVENFDLTLLQHVQNPYNDPTPETPLMNLQDLMPPTFNITNEHAILQVCITSAPDSHVYYQGARVTRLDLHFRYD